MKEDFIFANPYTSIYNLWPVIRCREVVPKFMRARARVESTLSTVLVGSRPAGREQRAYSNGTHCECHSLTQNPLPWSPARRAKGTGRRAMELFWNHGLYRYGVNNGHHNTQDRAPPLSNGPVCI